MTDTGGNMHGTGEHRRNQLAVTRSGCVFYGKSGLLKSLDPEHPLVPTGGNQCALLVDRYFPCCMEVEGQVAKGGTCPVIVAALE